MYGGFGVALGVLLLLAVRVPDYAPGIALTAAVALLGMAGGRVIGLCFERAGRWPWLFGALELLLGGALLATAVTGLPMGGR